MFGLEGKKEAASETPPRLAVVGCGAWGRNLVRAFATLECLVGVCDTDASRAAMLAAEFDVPSLHLDAALRDPTIDGMVISTPAAQHSVIAEAALRAGKHVFVEKPMALHSHEAEALIVLAKQTQRTLMVGHLMQYHPAFLKLKTLVSSGQLGQLRYIYSHRLNLGRFRQEENILWSFAPHDISMILELTGTLPQSVQAVGGRWLNPELDDVTITHLAFDDSLRAHIFVSWLHPFKEQKLVVVGDKAMAVFDDGQANDRKLQLYPHMVAWEGGLVLPVKSDMTPIEIDDTEPLLVECKEFVRSIQTGQQPRTDGNEGLRVLKVLEEAEESMRHSNRHFPFSGRNEIANPFPQDRRAQLHSSAYVDAGASIGEGTRVWHFSHILEGSVIGDDCNIGQNVMIGPNVRIGKGCKIQNNVSIYEGVTLEDDVFCGPSCVFTNVSRPRAFVKSKEFAPTFVGRGATIGANATIVCGHSIGEFAFIGAGSVVVADVPAHALVVGNPARQVGWVGHAGAQLNDDLECPLTGDRFQIDRSGKLVRRSA